MARIFLIGTVLVVLALSSTAQQPAPSSESQQTPTPSQAPSGSSLGDFARQQRAHNNSVPQPPANASQVPDKSQKSMAEIAAERRTRQTGAGKKSANKTLKRLENSKK